MNPLKKLINEIGLEVGEKFRIDNTDASTFYFSEGVDGKISLLSYWDVHQVPTLANSNYLYIVLNQPERIEKLPWKHKKGDVYHEIIDVEEDSLMVYKETFAGDIIDYENYILGNCFRTKEKAERNKDKYYKRLKEMYEKGTQINIFNINNIQNNESKKLPELPERKLPAITKRI